jgi:hypothetical protein
LAELYILEVKYGSMTKRLLTEAELLEEFSWLNKRLLREMRYRRRIPFYAPSYRIRLYDPEAILKALGRYEIRPLQKEEQQAHESKTEKVPCQRSLSSKQIRTTRS